MGPLLSVDLRAAFTMPSVGAGGLVPPFFLRFLFFLLDVESELVLPDPVSPLVATYPLLVGPDLDNVSLFCLTESQWDLANLRQLP